jgi:glutaredoxin
MWQRATGDQMTDVNNNSNSAIGSVGPLGAKILGTFRELSRDVLDLHALLEMAGGNPPEQREAVIDAVTELARRGLLRERGGDFYSLSEAGRLAIAGPHDLTLLGRPGCHLCEDAKKTIAPLAAEFKLPLREVNLDEDDTLRGQYGDDIPVLFLGQEEIARHGVDVGPLRERLQRIKQP